MMSAERGAERESGEECGTMSAGRDRVAEPVERTMTADSLRLTACGPDEDEIGVDEDTANG